MQIIIDDQNLDNGTYRRMLGQIKNTSIGGVQTIVASFIIQGDTPDSLNTRWQEAKNLFEKVNPRVVIYGDDTASAPTEDISYLDGRHHSCESTISWDPSYTQTSYRFVCTLTVAAATSLAARSSNNGASAFQGQQGQIKVITNYATGGTIQRTVEAQFGATFDPTKYGPFALNTAAPPSIINGTGGYAGKAQFILVGSLPTFKVGQKITVAGTVNYNGVFEVLAITGQNVQTSKPFGSTESPIAATGTIGEGKTGEENYNAAKSSLLTDYLETANDGGRDSTSRLALTGITTRTINAEGSAILATLSASEMVIDVSGAVASARQFDVVVSVQTPDKYNPNGGAVPIVYTGKGRVVVNKVALGSTNLSAVFESAKATIKAEVAAQAGVAPTSLKVVSLGQALSSDAMWVEFTISYMTTSVSALKYSVTTQESTAQPILSHRDSDGYHVLQLPPGPPDGEVTKVAHRIGYGRVGLAAAIAPPVQSGFTFIEASRSKIYEQPDLTPDGEEIWDEAWSVKFNRYRLRRGSGAVQGAQGSGGAFDGTGYFVPTGPDV